MEFVSGVIATLLVGLAVRKILKDREARKNRPSGGSGGGGKESGRDFEQQ